MVSYSVFFPTLLHRLLADAKFLHQKLSALKNVSTLSGMLETVVAEKNIPRKGPTAQPGMIVEPVKGPRAKGIFKSPVTEKPLPTPLPEHTGQNVIGIGRKDDINGRVTARLSSLMSPPASLPAIPREGNKGDTKEGQVTMESPEKDERPGAPSMPNSATAADPSEVATRSEKEVRNRVPSPPPERSPSREGENAPNSGVKARMFLSSPSHSPLIPHQLVDMTKPVMGSGEES
jgi:hypothetical protein